jgi:hypothetical protein
MQPPSEIPFQQSPETRPERPPNYLIRAIVLLLVLSPLCLLLGVSSLYTTWIILTGPAVISETPAWMRAFFELLRVVMGMCGFFIPIFAVFQALKVNREFDAGNYGGAAQASKLAGRRTKEGLILLVLVILVMAIDLLRYFTSVSDK